MKIENATALVAIAISVVTFDVILEVPAALTILGTVAAAFIGWQAGCLLEIIIANWGVKDPQPDEKPDVKNMQFEEAFRNAHDDFQDGI